VLRPGRPGLAEDLARRAAAAVDNARLYREAQAAFQAQDQAVALLDTFLETAPVGLAFFDRDCGTPGSTAKLAAINGVPARRTWAARWPRCCRTCRRPGTRDLAPRARDRRPV
jgi:hypothetical protein